jgi:hypothetical protein
MYTLVNIQWLAIVLAYEEGSLRAMDSNAQPIETDIF